MLRTCGRVLRTCAGAGFVDPSPDAGAFDWSAAIADIDRYHLAAAAIQVRDTLGYDSGQERGPSYDELRRLKFNTTSGSLTVAGATSGALAVLEAARIPFVVFKGPAVASAYEHPWQRPFTDIDVLVSTTDFQAARGAVRRIGYVDDETSRPPWDYFDRACREGVNMWSAEGGRLDVHHHVPPWNFGRQLTFADVLTDATLGSVGGVAVRVASYRHCAVIAGLHVLNDLYKNTPSLTSWRDLIVLRRRLGESAFADSYEAVGLGWLLPYVLVGIREITGETTPLMSAPAGPQRRRLMAMGWDGPSGFTRHPIGWAVRLPWPRSVLFVAGSLVPSPSYIHLYHQSYMHYWRRIFQSVRSTLKGEDLRHKSLRDL